VRTEVTAGSDAARAMSDGVAMHHCSVSPRSTAAACTLSCHAAARPAADRSGRTPVKHSTSQSCSNVSTPHATAWSSHRS
jgi:hypothetical protein